LVSDSVYNMLLKKKGKRSFSEVIVEIFQNREKIEKISQHLPEF